MPTLVHDSSSTHAALGDPEGWVNRFGDALFRFAVSRVGDRELAEDLVQETLLAAWRGRDAFDGESQPLTWLTAILRRRVADHFRHAGRRVVATTAPGPGLACPRSGPTGTAEDDEFWSVVTACTGQMPEHLARAFRLRTFGDDDPAAICAEEGISRKNLSVRLHRARHLLRRCLETRWFGAGEGGDR